MLTIDTCSMLCIQHRPIVQQCIGLLVLFHTLIFSFKMSRIHIRRFFHLWMFSLLTWLFFILSREHILWLIRNDDKQDTGMNSLVSSFFFWLSVFRYLFVVISLVVSSFSLMHGLCIFSSDLGRILRCLIPHYFEYYV